MLSRGSSQEGRVRELVRCNGLVAFFVLAFAITWGMAALGYAVLEDIPSWALVFVFLLAASGPAAAALIVAAVSGGRAGVGELLGLLARWRLPLRWLAVVLLGIPALQLLAFLLWAAFGDAPDRLGWPILQPATWFVGFAGVIGEELGWRGYALPKLLEDRSPLVASVILGVAWMLWHVGIAGAGPLPPDAVWLLVQSLAMIVGLTVIITWVFVHTRGSLLLAILAHGMFNQTVGPSDNPFVPLVFAVAAVALIVVTGPTLGWNDGGGAMRSGLTKRSER